MWAKTEVIVQGERRWAWACPSVRTEWHSFIDSHYDLRRAPAQLSAYGPEYRLDQLFLGFRQSGVQKILDHTAIQSLQKTLTGEMFSINKYSPKIRLIWNCFRKLGIRFKSNSTRTNSKAQLFYAHFQLLKLCIPRAIDSMCLSRFDT